ncbi:hypothetical protein LGM57_10705 [Burkholderia cepacia]|uniref:hypothetical protein n=1 Tax=Burkholderia cepacia TaxID=292 RepID=UPI001CF1996E|nr:hypothetical protein [Burkholderia cepacia]MCA7976790.1 hypothetical protein [Burkholderia cepacia]
MSDTENGQSTGIVGTVINELHQFEQKVEGMLNGGAPSGTEPVQEAGGAAVGEPAGTAASEQPSGSLVPVAADAQMNSAVPSQADAPAVAGAGESVNGASAPATGTSTTASATTSLSSALNATPLSAQDVASSPIQSSTADASSVLGESLAGSPSAGTGLTPSPITGDVEDTTTGDLMSTNAVNQAGDTTLTLATTSGTSELANVSIAAGTAVLAAAEESASAAADALLARWHREMSLLGRGLSAETEKLIRDTAAYLGV